MIELYFLLGFMIAGAIIAVQVKDLLSSVVAVGVVGLGLSVAFLILKAPDLAIVQLVVEILAVIILIRATITRDTTCSRMGTGRVIICVSLVFILVFLWFAWYPLNELPDFGHPTMSVASHYLENGLSETGATNIVTSVILDYRAYDTLGEATVLFTAVMGVLAVARTVGRKKPEEEVEAEND
jgi:multisubunit Na+/H+ antiporter MnhB subunit